MTYADVLAFRLTLPDTVLENHLGKPAVKTNGHAIVGGGREAGSFVLMIDAAHASAKSRPKPRRRKTT